MEEKRVFFSGFDISDQRDEDKINEIEAMETADVKLAEIIDIESIKSLMSDFYKHIHIPIRLNDLKGNVLIGVGLQDICTKFHWVHSEACKQCVEINTKLSSLVSPGEFRLYKCKNNMWDIVTPLMAGSQHVGYIFVGQFFFDDKLLDFEIFRSQARKYGFNEEEYIAALEKVPRMSREAVETGMSFFMTFANVLSQLSNSNIKMTQSLAKSDVLVETLQESEKREQALLDELAIVSDAVPAFMLITHDPQALKMTGNRVSHEWLKLPENANLSKSAPEGERPESYKLFKDGMEIPVENLPMKLAASGKEVRDFEMDIVYNDGTMRHLLGDAIPLRDEKGNSRGAVAAFLDITKRKEAEEKLRQSEEKYRNIVETANEGISTIDGRGLVTYANKKLLDMLGYCAEEFINKSSYVFVEDVATFEEKLEERRKGISDSSELKLICKDGSKLWVHASVKSLFDDKGDYVGSLGMFTDITKKKNAEKKLKETLDNLEYIVEERTSELKEAYELLKEREEGLSEAQEMAHIGNWNWNLLTNKLYYSDELYRIFGLSPQEFNINFDEVLRYIHPNDRICVINSVKEALNGKRFGDVEFRVVLANGTEKVVHAQGGVIFDENNIPIQMKGTVQDITERKKIEEKLQESEEKYRNIVETSNEGIYLVNDEAIVTYANKRIVELSGYTLEEIVGRPIWDFISEESKPVAKSNLEKRHLGVNESYELKLMRKDGLSIWAFISARPFFNEYDKLTGYLGMFTDITERKEAEEKLRESEEKYRNIVDLANEGILVIDEELIVTFYNRKLMEMLGYNSEEAIGRPIWDFIREESKDSVKINMEKRQQGINEIYELELICKNGSSIWVFLNSKSLFDKDGKFMGSISMLTDITKRKAAEQALANNEIARKKEIHHRIKNNLQVISSLLDLQADKFKNREFIMYSEVMEAFRESQDRVISMALIHEELYKGGGLEKLNFSPYVEVLTENLLHTYSLGNNNISLKRNLDENVLFDMDVAVPLGMIISELVSNSFKHAFKGRNEGEIRIKLHREENEAYFKSVNENIISTTFAMIVSDNGVGISSSLNIEELDSLGLQLVSSLVAQLDGELEIKRNNGTEFIIRFTVKEKNN